MGKCFISNAIVTATRSSVCGDRQRDRTVLLNTSNGTRPRAFRVSGAAGKTPTGSRRIPPLQAFLCSKQLIKEQIGCGTLGPLLIKIGISLIWFLVVHFEFLYFPPKQRELSCRCLRCETGGLNMHKFYQIRRRHARARFRILSPRH